MEANPSLIDSLEACRTCGTYFDTKKTYLRHIFTSSAENPEMELIVKQLAAWQLKINKDDGFPQYICTGCIYDFQKVIKLHQSCVQVQEMLRDFYDKRNENLAKMQIKIEPTNREDEENSCDFIYIDDVSDDEYDSAPFSILTIPIKIEQKPIEAATVPKEISSNVLDATFCAELPTEAAASNILDFEQTAAQILDEEVHNKSYVEKKSLETKPSVYNLFWNENPTIASVNIMEFDQQSAPQVLVEQVHSKSLASEILLNKSSKAPTLGNNKIFGNEKPANNIRCDLCPFISYSQEKHRIHMRSIHEVKDFTCYICGKTFKNSTATRLKFHIKFHKVNKHIKCVQCGFHCTSRDTLNEHIQAVHGRTKCTICSEVILAKNFKSHMRYHMITTDMDGIEEFSNRNEVDHMPAYDKNIYTELKEQECVPQQEDSQSSKRSDNADLHSSENSCNKIIDLTQPHNGNININNSSHDEVPLNEIGCQVWKFFKDTEDEPTVQENLENGNDIVESKQVPKERESRSDSSCESSSEEEVNRSALVNLEPFACAQCPRTFETISQLRTHHAEDLHNKKSFFSCHLCGKSFELKFGLNRHLKTHTKAPL